MYGMESWTDQDAFKAMKSVLLEKIEEHKKAGSNPAFILGLEAAYSLLKVAKNKMHQS